MHIGFSRCEHNIILCRYPGTGARALSVDSFQHFFPISIQTKRSILHICRPVTDQSYVHGSRGICLSGGSKFALYSSCNVSHGELSGYLVYSIAKFYVIP